MKNINYGIILDEVHPMVLRNCSDAFSCPLELIFKKSILEGRVPDAWREANVTPIFKKGIKLDPANYRPVSLTSVVCKVLETVFRDVIMNHLIRNELIASEQHGFVRKKASTTNLLETLNIITKALSSGLNVDAIYLDFAKAFDTVPHKRLLEKLKAFGLNKKICCWIEAFLSQQRVVLGEYVSNWS